MHNASLELMLLGAAVSGVVVSPPFFAGAELQLELAKQTRNTNISLNDSRWHKMANCGIVLDTV